jgi:hypothetical protein
MDEREVRLCMGRRTKRKAHQSYIGRTFARGCVEGRFDLMRCNTNARVKITICRGKHEIQESDWRKLG